MSKKAHAPRPAAGIKPQGPQIVRLRDGRILSMVWDFNAMADMQQISSADPRAVRAAEVMAAELDRAERAAREVAEAGGRYRAPEIGRADFLNAIAEIAYAATSSHREDEGIDLSYSQFRRLLPITPEKVRTLSEAVTAVMTAGQPEGEPGNAPEPPPEEST